AALRAALLRATRLPGHRADGGVRLVWHRRGRPAVHHGARSLKTTLSWKVWKGSKPSSAVGALAVRGLGDDTSGVARQHKDLGRLVKQLASLTPKERAKVIVRATPRPRFRPVPKGWKPPATKFGTAVL